MRCGFACCRQRRRNKFGDETRARDDKKESEADDVIWSCGLAGMAVARFNGPALETSEEGDGGREGCLP